MIRTSVVTERTRILRDSAKARAHMRSNSQADQGQQERVSRQEVENWIYEHVFRSNEACTYPAKCEHRPAYEVTRRTSGHRIGLFSVKISQSNLNVVAISQTYKPKRMKMSLVKTSPVVWIPKLSEQTSMRWSSSVPNSLERILA